MQNDVIVSAIKAGRKLADELKKPVIRNTASFRAEILPSGEESEKSRPLFSFSYNNDMQIVRLLPVVLAALLILWRFTRFIRKIF